MSNLVICYYPCYWKTKRNTETYGRRKNQAFWASCMWYEILEAKSLALWNGV